MGNGRDQEQRHYRATREQGADLIRGSDWYAAVVDDSYGISFRGSEQIVRYHGHVGRLRLVGRKEKPGHS